MQKCPIHVHVWLLYQLSTCMEKIRFRMQYKWLQWPFWLQLGISVQFLAQNDFEKFCSLAWLHCSYYHRLGFSQVVKLTFHICTHFFFIIKPYFLPRLLLTQYQFSSAQLELVEIQPCPHAGLFQAFQCLNGPGDEVIIYEIYGMQL